MEKIIPFFELNGVRYEIRRTRYLLAEYDELSKSADLSNDDKTNAIKAQSLLSDVQKYALKVQELEEKFFETFDDEDERRYLKAKELYAKAYDNFTKLEVENGSISKLNKQGIDTLEKIAIIGIAEQYKMDYEQAKKTWESYVDTVGKETASQWLLGMAECLFVKEEEPKDPFLSQMAKLRENK